MDKTEIIKEIFANKPKAVEKHEWVLFLLSDLVEYCNGNELFKASNAINDAIIEAKSEILDRPKHLT